MKKLYINDCCYPEKLRNIPDPPPFIYVDGNLKLLNSNCIAIIGSRNCSENGKKIAQKFSSELSTVGITIVSGLAVGIDSVAHESSYNKPGKTIAVLGSGLNKIFPEDNKSLCQKILNNNGLIISEYSPDEEATSSNFLHRNRIISGLSLGLLIVEALPRSGTSNTAKHARSQNKPIYTVPHEIWDSRGIGTNRLLKKDAKLITDTSEILKDLNLIRFRKKFLSLKSEGVFPNFTNKSAKNKTFASGNYSNTKAVKFDDLKQAKVYEVLKSSTSQQVCNYQKNLSINELASKSNLSVSEVLSVLFMLELNGYVKKVAGGYICI